MQDTILYVTDLFAKVEKPTRPPVPITVTEVSHKISATLEGRIGRIDVVGQVNSPRFGKHWYFSLTDGDSKIDCVMWASSVSALVQSAKGWKPEQGDQVVIRGTVGHYAKFGKTQIVVQRMKPAGDEKGDLQKEYEALLKKYQDAGWFDDAHKKQLPKYPHLVAVVTSATSAALKDVIETARRRMPSVRLLVVNALMQGDASSDSVSNAIQRIDKAAEELGIDAIIVTRGGGGLEELWSFNDERVIEAAFNCQTPIVAAIGHESDTTIIELVADHRASTPTQAAMVLVPDREELLQMVVHFSMRLKSIVLRHVERLQSSVKHTEQHVNSSILSWLHTLSMHVSKQSEVLVSKRPHALLTERQKRVLYYDSAIQSACRHNLAVLQQRLTALDSRLESIGPMQVLGRGYSLTQDSSGKVVRTHEDVREGDQIRTLLADGSIESTVECTHEQ